MSAPVRFALVGTGNISGIHAQAISEIPGAQLTAACATCARKYASTTSITW
jgi:predicted dehydrogenase